MKREQFLEGYGLVFGNRNRVMVWHAGLNSPMQLAVRSDTEDPEDSLDSHHVNTVAFIGGNLYDAGYEGAVRRTLTGDPVNPRPEGIFSKREPIFAIGQIGGAMIELGSSGIMALLRETEKDYRKTGIHLGSDNDRSSTFLYKRGSLDLAVANGRVFVSSENVAEVVGGSVEKLTGYLADFVRLASDGHQVYSLHCSNALRSPDGVEVRTVPSRKRVTFWRPDGFGGRYGHLGTEVYGFVDMAALADDFLVVGTHTYGAGRRNRFWGIEITPEMMAEEGGVEAEPVLLLEDAYDSGKNYGRGNPLTVLSRETLEGLV